MLTDTEGNLGSFVLRNIQDDSKVHDGRIIFADCSNDHSMTNHLN